MGARHVRRRHLRSPRRRLRAVPSVDAKWLVPHFEKIALRPRRSCSRHLRQRPCSRRPDRRARARSSPRPSGFSSASSPTPAAGCGPHSTPTASMKRASSTCGRRRSCVPRSARPARSCSATHTASPIKATSNTRRASCRASHRARLRRRRALKPSPSCPARSCSRRAQLACAPAPTTRCSLPGTASRSSASSPRGARPITHRRSHSRYVSRASCATRWSPAIAVARVFHEGVTKQLDGTPRRLRVLRRGVPGKRLAEATGDRSWWDLGTRLVGSIRARFVEDRARRRRVLHVTGRAIRCSSIAPGVASRQRHPLGGGPSATQAMLQARARRGRCRRHSRSPSGYLAASG